MQSAKKEIRQALAGYYSSEEINVFARYFLEKIVGVSSVGLLADWNRTLTAEQREQFRQMTERLKTYEPIQYILGECYFSGLVFHVRPGVLIPRPETEELVLRIAEEWKGKEARLLDIGTGSGCIAIALADRLPQCKVSAWDISAEALDIARENAVLNNLSIDFQQKNILEEPIGETFNVIVSNPPYVLEGEKDVMEPNVLRYEPEIALFVPDADPLLFYRRIATLALQALTPEGTLYFEINQAYGKETQELLQTIGFCQVELVQDCFGKDRIIKAKR